TIDKAGRIVIPKSIRERYHLQPGTELQIESESDGISLKICGKEPSIIRKRGILVHHGSDTLTLDTADFVNRLRESRNLELTRDSAAEGPKE
ncbi:MAG: AbrB/MazE/SpoVT family DNA-binding domain-containing protein, partial [Spirochaetota bacterium]